MSYSRTIARSIERTKRENAARIARYCPVCGRDMKPVWYSRRKRKCPNCKTTVRVPFLPTTTG